MRNSSIFLFAALCTLFACTKDSEQANPALQNLGVDFRGNGEKVTICHIDDYGVFHAITVSVNALPAHLAHGDYLPDADGDGYTAIGACTGSMDDCDDNDASVYPGAAGSCCFPFFTEESVNSNAPFFAYYDSDVAVCDFIFFGEFQGVWIFLEDDLFPAVLAIELDGEKVVASLTEEGECVAIVGVDITEEQYQSALATLRAVIAANPGTPNICDFFPSAPVNPIARSFDNEAFREKAKTISAEKLREMLSDK